MSIESSLIVATFAIGLAITAILVRGDVRDRRISNRGVLQLAAVAIGGLGLAVLVGERDVRSLGSMVLGAAAFGAPWLAVRLVSRGGMGWGDIKLATALGLYLGWLGLVVAVGAIVVTSAVFAAVLVVSTRRAADGRRALAAPASRSFAPILAAGAVLTGLGTGW